MGRFSDNGLKKSDARQVSKDVLESSLPSSDRSDAVSLDVEKETNKPIHQHIEPINQYTEKQMKPVNVGGFRVPLVVRAHWQSKAKFSGEKVAPQLRQYLVERYGLPDGIDEDDLMC